MLRIYKSVIALFAALVRTAAATAVSKRKFVHVLCKISPSTENSLILLLVREHAVACRALAPRAHPVFAA